MDRRDRLQLSARSLDPGIADPGRPRCRLEPRLEALHVGRAPGRDLAPGLVEDRCEGVGHEPGMMPLRSERVPQNAGRDSVTSGD
jgi:hypothetical protein